MSTALHVVGFAADIVGSENEIIEAAPAFVRSDDLTRVYVATGLDWSLASATELLVGDEQFIHFVRPTDRTMLSEGHTVWVAGRAFADSVRSSSWTSRIASPITGWDTLTNGFRWALGHRTKFHELVTAISNGLEQGLHHSLFDSLEKSHGDADKLISLYSSLPVPSGRRQLLNRALYAQETRDEYSFEFIQTLAVEVERTHENSDSFRRDVATLSDSLRQNRLAESSDEITAHHEAIFDAREFAQIHNVWSQIGMGIDLTKTLEALSKLQRASGSLAADRGLYPRG